MNQSKKILAAMLAIPATVIVAGQVQAEEVISTFEIKNSFVGESPVAAIPSSPTIDATNKGELINSVLTEMALFTKGFTVTYTGSDVVDYENDIKAIFEELKTKLNTTEIIGTTTIDYTMLYGMFNNVQVKATETKTNGIIDSVELAFSFNYFADSNNSTGLNNLADKLTGTTSDSILTTSTNDFEKVKAIHDYLINDYYILPTNHSAVNLTSQKGGSSHAYALWAYKLLKAAGLDVRYVSGMSGGELHSWNLVKVDGEWYHLDVADNDNSVKNSKDIKYRYFLAANTTIGGRVINNGAENIGQWGTAFTAFEKIVNPAQSANAMYYAGGVSNSEIFKLELKNQPYTPTPIISGATSGHGKILYYMETTQAIEYLYFINDAGGKYLYQYDITNNNNNNNPQIIIKEPIKSISIEGSRLTYTPMSGTDKSILLNQLTTANKTEADKVIKAIEDLKNSNLDFTIQANKAKVLAVRNLYTALTPEQQALVTNITDLEDIEKETANSDGDVEKVIKQINALDILKPTYIQDVKDAKSDFDNSLTFDQRSQVYNKPILDDAIKRVDEAKLLNDEISKIVSVSNEPFKTDAEFIQKLEAVMTKYEDLLPSLKKAIGLAEENYMNTYSTIAKDLRNELQTFINKVSIIDDNALDYLTLMDSIEIDYKGLYVSQKHLLTSVQITKIDSNILKAKTMLDEITQFNDYMATVATTPDAGNIVFTPKIIEDMMAADALYQSMKPSQKEKLVQADITKIEAIMQRITGLVNDPDVITVKESIEKLDYTKATIDVLIKAVGDAVAAFNALGPVKQPFIPEPLKDKLDEYNKAIIDIKKIIDDIQAEIDGLTDKSPESDVSSVRAKLDALGEIQKHYVLPDNLVAQEERILKDKDKALAQPVIDAINRLTDRSTVDEVKKVIDLFEALPDEAKPHVTNKKRLDALWDKVNADAAEIKKAIDHVNKLIAALNSKSTREQILEARAAYNALPSSARDKVVGYEKIAELLAALDKEEVEFADREAARLVEEKINALSDESTSAEIKAARDAYEALNENAKKLVSKKMLDLLVFYENSMKEQMEQAQKEAQVVIDRIDRITESYTEAQIKDVRLAYNALSELAKSYVTNLQKLIDAEEYILYENTVVKEAKLEAAAFDAYMAGISRDASKKEIRKAREYYDDLSTQAKKYVKMYEKLRRLETMWDDSDYLDLVFTYYPDYIDAVKPGGIELEDTEYDPLYIPDDVDSLAYLEPDVMWSRYEEMTYDNKRNRYTTSIEASQVQNVVDKTLMLTAEEIEILIPTADIKGAFATVGVSMTTDNNRLVISFTEGREAKVFSDFVEIRVPMRILGGTPSMAVQRASYNETTPANFKVEGSDFIIRTKIGGTFTASTNTTTYSDLGSSKTSVIAISEFAKRGVTYSISGNAVNPNKNVTRADVATLLGKALDVSSTKATKYTDLKGMVSSNHAQGLLEAGIMSGVTAQQFRPQSVVSRQEAAIIIANMYRYLDQDLSLAYNELKTNFRDVSHLSYEARQSIAILELFGVVDGTASSKFNPDQKLTRAEFAEMLYNALNAIDYL